MAEKKDNNTHLVPVSKWTMEKEGSRRVRIEDLDDKREITAVVGASSTGMLLPIQILYAGETGTYGIALTIGLMRV